MHKVALQPNISIQKSRSMVERLRWEKLTVDYASGSVSSVASAGASAVSSAGASAELAP